MSRDVAADGLRFHAENESSLPLVAYSFGVTKNETTILFR